MDSAIITGATGLIGSALVRYLNSLGVNVICLGRKRLDDDQQVNLFGCGSNYINIDMNEIATLPFRINKLGWQSLGDTVFYNFSWKGVNKISDGTFADQLKNVHHAGEAVKVAKKLSCKAFVNCGTLQETFVEHALGAGSDIKDLTHQADYALAKLAARDMCKMVAYLERLNYVHTRLSLPVSSDLDQGSYILSTLKNISFCRPYDSPKNKQVYDVIHLNDVVHAYYKIGLLGKNKADYFIGSSGPVTLENFFSRAESIVKYERLGAVDRQRWPTFVDDGSLSRDTGVVVNKNYDEILKMMLLL